MGYIAYSFTEYGVKQYYTEIPEGVPPEYLVIMDEYEEYCGL
jgi:hypothetical protein